MKANNFPFSICRPLLGFLFVNVGVISWIVLHFSGKQAIHEVTRNKPYKCQNDE
ncbi:MAG: hypothetical protein QOI77_2091 [Blastocatellia bacterium]|jgi:hypothetical protein|nr:hypothetical protein [Blastocatellia bacterium]